MNEDLKNNLTSSKDFDALSAAFLAPTIDVNSDEKIVVNAEDIVYGGGGIDFEKHFFEPQPGNTYTIKILPNAGYPQTQQIGVRSLYRSLPDPERKGKTFQYVSVSGLQKCDVLNLFFDLKKLEEEENNAVAKAKKDKYLKRSAQACVKIQVLSSPKKEEIGMIRLFVFPNAGPNATTMHLLDKKLNPTKEQIANGFEKEDIFNIFESSVISLTCKESEFDGNKGREYTGSDWIPKKRGAIGILEDGTTHEFSMKDLENGKVKPEVMPFFNAFVKQATNPDYDMYQYFLPKLPGDKRNTEATDEYLTKVMAKVAEIVPIIAEKSLAEIANYGRTETASTTGSEKQSKDILKESIPTELQNAVNAKGNSKDETKTEKKETKATVSEIDDILAD